MDEILLYFAKVNIAIAVFFLFFRLVFYNDTLWKARRLHLVVSVVIAIVYPLVSLTGWLEKQEPMQVILSDYTSTMPEIVIQKNTPPPINYETIAFYLYGIVVLILLTRTCIQLASIFRWKLKSKKTLLQGISVLSIDRNIAPFSFFKMIFINPALHTEPEIQQILAHEQTHARQWHSLDVLLSEMITISCWINPAAWLMKREVRQNLEFLADNSVLQSGFDSKNYQYHLLQLSYQIPDVGLANKFNVLPLKKRIMKMNQQKTSKAGILKYALIVPVALVLVLSSNAQTVVNKAKENLSSDKKKTEKTVAPVTPQNNATNDRPLDVVEKMPDYPGGDRALMNYLSNNIRYPIDAQQKGIQGKVILRFVVDLKGLVRDVEVLRSVSPSIDKEAIRVVSAMPQWIPGKQQGKNVSVYYTLPISFKLDNPKISNKQALERNKEALERNKEALERNKEALERNKEALERNKEAAQRNKEAIERNKEAVQRNKEAVERNKEAVKSTEDIKH